MIDRELAVRATQEDLDRRYSGRLVVSATEEHELVWIVCYQSAEYLRTGDLSHMLGGNGPYLVGFVHRFRFWLNFRGGLTGRNVEPL